MAAESTIIDLGVIRTDAPEAPARLPFRHRLRRWRMRLERWRRHRGLLIAAVLAALLLATAAAAALPPPPWLAAHFTVPAGPVSGRFQVTDEILYVNGRGDNGDASLSAYRLSDGALLWEVQHRDAYFWGGAPVLMSHDSVETPQARVLDPVTGEQRWQGRGLLAVVGDRVLVRAQGAPRSAGFQLSAIDLATGAPVWTVPSVSNRGFAIHPGSEQVSPRVIAVSGQGQLASYALSTGTQLAVAAEPPMPPVASVRAIGKLVLVEPADGSGLRAYDAAELTAVWRMPAGITAAMVTGCGPVLCVDGGDGVPYTADPDTGRRLWTAHWFAEQRYVLRSLDPPWPAEFLLLRGEFDGLPLARNLDGIPHWLVDAGSGSPVLDLRQWRPLTALPQPGGAERAMPVLTRYQPGDAGGEAQALPGQAPEFAWFARLHPDPPAIEVLGAVPSRPNGCLLGIGYLACEQSREIQVWRVR